MWSVSVRVAPAARTLLGSEQEVRDAIQAEEVQLQGLSGSGAKVTLLTF